MIRLIASDLDGTLLTQFGRVSEYTAQTIKEIQEKDVRFVVCTGREYYSANMIVGASGVACDYICNSGATWVDEQGTVIHNVSMQPDMVRTVWDLLMEEHMLTQIVTDGGQAVPQNRAEVTEYLKNILFPALSKASGMDYGHDLDRFLAGYLTEYPMERIFSGAAPAYKIMTVSMDREQMARVRAKLADLPLSVVSTSPINLEISGLEARKGIAVQSYAQRFGISPEEILVLGDSENDINMFEVPFAHRIAMGNADQIIKDRATFITKTNREDGAAYAMRRFVLEG